MKWIFALNEESLGSYGDYARVAVLSARKHSSLDAVCLFDGEEGEFTRWLESQNVEVIRVRSRLYEPIARLARERNKPFWLQMGQGTFLRMEIPRLSRELSWDDEFVFYTDCDVMFQNDPRPFLQPLRPRFFAAAPEVWPDKPLHMNAGVLWMNVRTLGDAAFEAWLDRNLERCCNWQFDQTAYRVYYNPLHLRAWNLGAPYKATYSVLSRLPLRTYGWDDLPLELNWKPYWGEAPKASVIHFQGLKPSNRAEIKNEGFDPFIAQMNTPFFEECAKRWDTWLEEARAS